MIVSPWGDLDGVLHHSRIEEVVLHRLPNMKPPTLVAEEARAREPRALPDEQPR